MTVSVFRLIVIVVRAICLGSKAVRLADFIAAGLPTLNRAS
jgi:hypothetical protein